VFLLGKTRTLRLGLCVQFVANKSECIEPL